MNFQSATPDSPILQSLDFLVLGVYLLILVAIGVSVSYRRRHEEDQFLAGRSFGWGNVGLSIFGTNVSPSFLIGSASAAYVTGMATANFEWLAWLFLMLLAMVFAPHYLNTKISTMPQFVRRRFGSRAAEFVSWYSLLSTVILWLGGTLYASGLLLSQILGWPLWFSATALMAVAAFLTVAGGLAVVIITDSFQSILIVAGGIMLTAIGLHEVGGIDGLMEAVPADRWKLFRPADDPNYPWYAIVLGYPVLGIWFWCTDQTIVQRVLGGRDLRQGQLGAVFTGFLKILTPLIFTLPGILCFVLHPGLDDPDKAFMTMVSHHLPVGLVGLVVAVLVAALISTIDSGLNSFSTIFTLDVYARRIRPDATARERKLVGRLATVAIAVISIGIALSMQTVGKNLFDLLQSIIAYFAPPLAAVFLVGVLWRRATGTAALLTLCLGSAVSLGIGAMDFLKFPHPDFWPHFMLNAFFLFAGLCVLMVVTSLLTKPSPDEQQLPTLRESSEAAAAGSTTRVWTLWAILAAIMLGLYLVFN